MSASLVVDLGNTCQLELSVGLGGAGSGLIYPCSGAVIGDIVNLNDGHILTNLVAMGNRVFGSGQVRLQVQCSQTTNSGDFTDPTSGLASFPGAFTSGGILTLGANSGGTLGVATSGQNIQSGFFEAQAFQRTGPFARVNVLSGDFFAGVLAVGFVSQRHVTGSGGGFSLSPGSGTVNV